MNEQENEEADEENDEVDPNFVNVYEYDDNEFRPTTMADLGDEGGITSVEAKKYNIANMLDENEYYDLCNSLNKKQRDYLMHIISNFKTHQDPIHHFVSGGAGVGKSRLIQAIYQSLGRIFSSDAGEAGLLQVLIVAPTGKAAHNVGGMTAHHAFSLPMVSNRSYLEKVLPLGPEALNTVRTNLAQLKVVIIDEISMLSSSNFSSINDRLNQIVGVADNNTIFGGKSVIVVGDFQQLRPVQGNFAYEPAISDNPLNQLVERHPLWLNFKLFELTEIMGQKDDKVFAEALNRLARGSCSTADVQLFESRIFTENTLPAEGKSAIRLIYSNEAVNHYNTVRANASRSPNDLYAISEAVDVITGYRNETEKRQTKHNLKDKPYNKTQGLPQTLKLQQNMRYTVTSNI